MIPKSKRKGTAYASTEDCVSFTLHKTSMHAPYAGGSLSSTTLPRWSLWAFPLSLKEANTTLQKSSEATSKDQITETVLWALRHS